MGEIEWKLTEKVDSERMARVGGKAKQETDKKIEC